jgi:hypothetical protein
MPHPGDFYFLWWCTRASLWVHNLYFTVETSTVDSAVRAVIESNGKSGPDPTLAPRLWISNTTFQGGTVSSPALDLWATEPRRLYMEGVTSATVVAVLRRRTDVRSTVLPEEPANACPCLLDATDHPTCPKLGGAT